MSNNEPDYEDNLFFEPKDYSMPYCDILELKSQIKHLKDLQENQDKEIESLRDLLKICREILDDEGYYQTVCKINTAIGESEEL